MPLVERVEEGSSPASVGGSIRRRYTSTPPGREDQRRPRLLKVGLDSQRQALGMSLGRHEVDHTIEVEDDVIDRAIDLMPPDVAALYLAAKAEKQDAILRPYLERAAAGEAAGEPASRQLEERRRAEQTRQAQADELEEIRQRYQASLLEFTRFAWAILEPGPLVVGRDTDAIIQHAEAFMRGDPEAGGQCAARVG